MSSMNLFFRPQVLHPSTMLASVACLHPRRVLGAMVVPSLALHSLRLTLKQSLDTARNRTIKDSQSAV